MWDTLKISRTKNTQIFIDDGRTGRFLLGCAESKSGTSFAYIVSEHVAIDCRLVLWRTASSGCRGLVASAISNTLAAIQRRKLPKSYHTPKSWHHTYEFKRKTGASKNLQFLGVRQRVYLYLYPYKLPSPLDFGHPSPP